MIYRVALAGCGRMGSRYDDGRNPPTPPYSHAGAVTQHPKFQLVAVADSDELNRRDCAARWGTASYADVGEMLQAHKPDVLIVATPSEIRLGPILAAAEVRAIVCEKPLALSVAEADEIIQACGEKPVLVNFSRRWDTAAQSAAAWVEKLGPVQHVRGLYVNGIANNGAHLLDLINWWCGGIAEMTEHYPVYAGSPEIRFRLEKGGGGSLVPVSGYDIFELDVFCQGGVIRLRDSGYTITVQTLADANALTRWPALQSPEKLPSGLDLALPRMLDNLAAVLEGQEKPACGLPEGLAVTRLLDSIERLSR